MPAPKAPAPITACRSCGARIWWGLSASGKRAPIDEKPDQRLQVAGTTAAGVPVLRSVWVWVSHFVTCPNADQHRRKVTPISPISEESGKATRESLIFTIGVCAIFWLLVSAAHTGYLYWVCDGHVVQNGFSWAICLP